MAETPVRPPRLAPDGRVFVMGHTGTGKSTFARWLFAVGTGGRRHTWRVVVDPQDRHRLVEQEGVCETYGDPSSIDWSAQTIRFSAGADTDSYEWLFAELNERRRIAVWIDELELVWDRRKRSELRRLYTAGRAEGRMVIGVSQMPVEVEPAAFSQSDAFVVFQLQRLDDIERVARHIGMRREELQTRLAALPPRVVAERDGPDVRRSSAFLWFDGTRGASSWWEPLPASYLATADEVVTAVA